MAPPKKSKRFIYNLTSALKVRAIRETLQKEEVNKAERALQEEREKLRLIEEQLATEHQAIIDMYTSGKPIDLGEIFLRKHHLDVLKIQLEEQEKAVERAIQKKKEEEKKLIQAIKDKKILEKDREKKQEMWKKLMDKEDGKFLDDISVSRFFRNKTEKEARA